jgi:ABC-type Fe3+/spermidine/putrescine transport system ATPase subunit
MSAVRLEAVRKAFGTVAVVRDLSLDVAQGELLALLGPSGSGKTTVLRMIAGFESADAGRITLGDRDVTRLDALGRRCGMVFQHYALFPHLNVRENVGYGLAHERLDAAARAERVREALAMVDLEGLADRPIAALSGGQQQRVALARALAPRPAVLLLDEPLSNLDPSLRERTRRELRDLVRRIGITTILVTHEQEEAFELADRVALLLGGRLAQVGTPEELYQRPASAAVARFVGRSSTVTAQVVAHVHPGLKGLLVAALGGEFECTGDPALRGAVSLVLRPEALVANPTGKVAGHVLRRRFLGHVDYLTIEVGGQEVEVMAAPQGVRVGELIRFAPTGVGAHAFAEDGA